jgi:hypothetical protein
VSFVQKTVFAQSAFSGRLTIAGAFIAGDEKCETKSVKRTTEKSRYLALTISAVRFTDYNHFAPNPSSELLGYYHSSADAD